MSVFRVTTYCSLPQSFSRTISHHPAAANLRKKVRSIRNRKSGPLPFRGGACFPSGTFAPGSRVVFVPNPKLVSPDPSPRLQSPGTTSMRPIAIGNGSPISRGSRPPRPLSDSPEYEFGETLGNKTLCRRLRKPWEDEVPGN